MAIVKLPLEGFMEFLFSKERLMKTAAAAGQEYEKLQWFGKEEVFEAYRFFYDRAFENMLAGNLSIAQVQFEYLSQIEVHGNEFIGITDPMRLLTEMKASAELKEKNKFLMDKICLVEELISRSKNDTKILQINMALFAIKEVLLEFKKDKMYANSFVSMYIESIELQLCDISKTLLSSLQDMGELYTYDQLMSLIEEV